MIADLTAQGWSHGPLATYATRVITGPFGSSLHKSDYGRVGVPIVNPINLRNGEIVANAEKLISDRKASELGQYRLEVGDVVVGRRGDIGRCAVVADRHRGWICGTGCFIVRPGELLDASYLALLIESDGYRTRLAQLAGGATMSNLSNSALAGLEICVPPLEEQKRIVAILDAAFADIDQVAETVGQCELMSQQVFQSWLRGAFDQTSTGRAPQSREPERPEVGTEGSFIEPNSVATSTQTRTGGRDATTRSIAGDLSLSVGPTDMSARDGWTWSDLSELARMESGHTPSRRNPEYWSGSIPWIGIQDAKKSHGGWISDTSQKVTAAGVENSSTRVLPARTVCLSRTASVGYVVIMEREMATSQDFANWICGPDLDPEFLQFALLAEGRDLLKFASGAVHQTIYYPELKALRICHPSVGRQRELVAELKQVRAESDELHGSYARKSASVVNLRQSLLHRAFSGQL